MILSKQIGIAFVLILMIAACGGTATIAPTSAPEPTAAVETLTVGHQLFVTKGCAACHGQVGEGSAIAPALGATQGTK